MFDEYSSILTTDDLAAILKFNKKTILRLIKEGNIPYMKMGNQYRFSKEKIIEWINSHMSDFFDLQVFKNRYPLKDLRIADCLRSAHIVHNPPGHDKFEMFKELITLADTDISVNDREELLQMVIFREKQFSTAIGPNFALPHPRSVTTHLLKEIFIAVGIFKDGFLYDPEAEKKVQIVILFAVPYLPLHLEILSRLVKLLAIEEFKQQIIESNNSEDVINLFRQYEQNLPSPDTN